MAHDVFISYAIEDKHVTELVSKALEADGIKCWYAPRDVPFGVDYEVAIVDAICDSQLVVLILSSHSNTSPHVRREIQNAYAEDVARPILPMRIDDTPLHKALRYYLGSTQWLDAATPPIDSHLQRLIEQLRARLPRLAVTGVEESASHDLESAEQRKGKETERETARQPGEPRQRDAESEHDAVEEQAVAAREKFGWRAALIHRVRMSSAMTRTILIVLGSLALITISFVIVYLIHAQRPGGMGSVSTSIGEYTIKASVFLALEGATIYLYLRWSRFRHWWWRWLLGGVFAFAIVFFIAAWNDRLSRLKIPVSSQTSDSQATQGNSNVTVNPLDTTRSIRVRVTTTRGRPVENVEVFLATITDGTLNRVDEKTTDAKGEYAFENARPFRGEEAYVIPPDGFEIVSRSENFGGDQTIISYKIARKRVRNTNK